MEVFVVFDEVDWEIYSIMNVYTNADLAKNVSNIWRRVTIF